MKFNTIDELVEYLYQNKQTIGDLTFVEDVEDVEDVIESIKISTLIQAPHSVFEVLDIPHNIIYVERVDAIAESCGAGNIVLNESTLFLNICCVDGENTTNMNLCINGNNINVPLTIKESTDEKIILSKEWVKENITRAK